MGLTLNFNDPELNPILKALLGAMAVDTLPADARHQTRRLHGSAGGPFLIDAANDIPEAYCRDLNELLYAIEKPFIIEAQRLAGTQALYLHAAVFEMAGKAVAVAGPTYGGKSTLAHYALAQAHTLLSDELAPITLKGLGVAPYPRGIRLRVPAGPDAFALGPNLSIRPWVGSGAGSPRPLAAIYVLSGEVAAPLSAPITNQAAALQALYPATLNSLAHDRAGLDALQNIVGQVPVFTLNRGPLDEMLAVITR